MTQIPTRAWVCAMICAAGSLFLSGCGGGGFDGETARALLNAQPIPLESEQVSLTMQQVRCGEADELWLLTPLGGSRFIGRLNDKARELGFSDDIHVGDDGYSQPYAQVRGTFSVEALNIGEMQDESPSSKLVEASVGVVVDNTCFQQPLPKVMGVRKGAFSESVKPTFRFVRNGEVWSVDRLVH